MDLDIQFGEVEETPPQTRLRPDRNKQFAVAAVQSPSDRDLPIFVDLDVMRDMESHADSDTSVELGGVLLGGQHHDEEGKPFVLVTDSLRAQHFEATKGSFKFTHDTWSQISRERDEFPDDLQMVGWYHTHPDWGVFLSGMDMFICDNFFNKPLDVALVIDPCRGDRGMFQWTGDPRKRIRRTDGFYLVASRFRQAELELHAALFEGNLPMPQEHRYSGLPSMAAPVVNIAEPRQAQWQMVAIMGMLTMQFLLVAMLAWKLLDPLAKPADADAEKRIAELEKTLEDMSSADAEAARVKAQKQVIDRVVSGLQGGQPRDLVQSLEDAELARARLDDQVEYQQQAVRQYQSDLKETKDKLKDAEKLTQKREATIKDKDEELADLKKSKELFKKRLAKYEEVEPDDEDKKEDDGKWWTKPWFLAALTGVLLVGLAALGVIWSIRTRNMMIEEEEEERRRLPAFRETPENDDEIANNP